MFKITFLALLFSIFSHSQSFQGKAYYMSKISVDKSFLDNPRRAQWRGYLEKMLKDNTEKNYVLEFNSNESIYKEEEKLEVDDGRGGFNWMAQYMGDNIGKLYKNNSDNISVNETEFMGRFFLLTDSLNQNKWKMSGESKKIGQYTCYKASYIKKVEEKAFSFSNWNQSNQSPKKKKFRDVEVVAWFTPEIPISSGPAFYGGLPGLIMEVTDDKTKILCTKIIMNPKEKSKIKRPKKGKIINTPDFLVLQDKKRIEMREIWQKDRARRQSSSSSNR
tara:strand:- start:426 stop:1253 length:828 start_codon:yes stop_codon:yes gene_type:complete